MGIEYVAVYNNWVGWEKGEAPVGIVVAERIYAPDLESLVYHAMHWDHLQQGWVYDPEGNAQYLAEISEERIRGIERGEAERVTPGITGGEGLPDEDTIRWIFQWKGAPPQAEDTGY
ncbi:hypothetical protein Rhe02_50130 [Rhizocola hellebori]|uniref:Uncharacterized protein n=1 Tax=Rhizocola hellebori TaxID=1392758 RepID=A0A8J3QAI5_9ACTN|nr:hypothetical protein [Rhizocola hellebori]GIH06946.1 hypothetical protein Rhe02_50130 [Rhizocola hellebori]